MIKSDSRKIGEEEVAKCLPLFFYYYYTPLPHVLVGSKGHGSLSSGIPSPSDSTGGGTLTQNGG
jgi:hypothetical protein